MKKEHKYGMRQRGYSLGCQPMNGLIRRENSTDGVYWDILVYDHELTERECQQYGLDDLTKEDLKMSNKKMNIIRKVHITYKMIRGANDNEIAETCVDLPISQERYDELAEGINGESEVWRTVREALLNLTYLQGYNKLGAWSIELEIDG